MSFVLKASLLAVCAGTFLSGCAATLPRPIQTDAALGRVVVYRNGVAYFERRALVHGDRFALSVPAERLDDFLKSLSVVDARSGNAVPISFPTLEHAEGITTVMVNLPRPGDYDLRISYVTESPAWKPTYRLKLSEGHPAELQSWAVVDNVSGEDWQHVAVGVGSTSALSFKYDLQSVRYVERETLTGTVLGVVADARFAAVFAAGSRPEVSIVGRLPREGRPPVLVSGQIDRLVVTDHEVLIVDFKTNLAPPGTVVETPSAYVRQLALYRAVLRQLYPARIVRAALLWTEAPEFMEVSACALDAALASQHGAVSVLDPATPRS